jgi:hypothetical protein
LLKLWSRHAALCPIKDDGGRLPGSYRLRTSVNILPIEINL